MTIVLRAPNWIGDCIMCLPALRALRFYCPDDAIYLVTKRHLADIFVTIPGINGIIIIPDTIGITNISATAATLKPYGFGEGILFTNSFSSAILFRLAGIPHLTGYGKDMRGVLLAESLPFFRHSSKHHVFFYMDLVERFLKVQRGIDVRHSDREKWAGFSTDLIITEAERAGLRQLVLPTAVDWTKFLVGISPSAAYGTAKQWVPVRFSILIEKLLRQYPQMEILMFGADGERKKIDTIMSDISVSVQRVHNLAGQLTLRQSVVAISMCNAFVANDSGLMHVAAALGVPLVAIFGPTVPHNTAPFSEKTNRTVILHHPVSCAPCRYRNCPFDHSCMKAISVDQVFDALQSVGESPLGGMTRDD